MSIKDGSVIEIEYKKGNYNWFYVHSVNDRMNLMLISPFVFGVWEILYQMRLSFFNNDAFFKLKFPDTIYSTRLICLGAVYNCGISSSNVTDIVWYVDTPQKEQVKKALDWCMSNNINTSKMHQRILNEFSILDCAPSI
jgi:hypothetical protein